MNGFIECLEEWSEENSRVKAVLRRSLAFDPGKFCNAFPYVEPFLKNEENSWNRKMYYLVAGLWALHWKPDRSRDKISIAKACAMYMEKSGSKSTETRFISVIDADPDQLSYRLRQLVSFLKDYPIDFLELLKDLLYWNSENKLTQIKWARNFYRALSKED